MTACRPGPKTKLISYDSGYGGVRAAVAQMVEHLAVNEVVPGSSPGGGGCRAERLHGHPGVCAAGPGTSPDGQSPGDASGRYSRLTTFQVPV